MTNPNFRQYDFSDRVCNAFDTMFSTLCAGPKRPERQSPAAKFPEAPLTEEQRKDVAGLMRVDHCGEVCAQALYQGQALTAREKKVRLSMQQAAAEENDHLAWTAERLQQLKSHTSYLNILWYSGSLAIGVTAGLIGDKWNLGFVAETEKQVVAHLHDHLQRLPQQDKKSKAILEQMKKDEQQHATSAMTAGGVELPKPVKALMGCMSKVMTSVAYWV